MDIDIDIAMETPKSSSVDVDMTSATTRHITPLAVLDAEPPNHMAAAAAGQRHIVPTVEPSIAPQVLPQLLRDAVVKPAPAISSSTFKATNNGSHSPFHMSFSQQREGGEIDSPGVETRTEEGTPYENDSAEEDKSSVEPALSTTEEPADVTPPAEEIEEETAATNDLASDMPSLDDDDNLSPPPESIDDQILEDQIVVAKGKAASANAASAVNRNKLPEDVDEDDDEDDDDDDEHDHIKGNRHPKRKRNSLYDDLAEEKMDLGSIGAPDEDGTVASTPASESLQNGNPLAHKETAKPILLGYWRESHAPDPDQHVVKGFIDSRDRLRTRIQTHNRAGDNITAKYPLKPGPGGSWVTFHNIVFDEHLVHLDQHQVKEYVKIRSGFQDKEGEDPKANDKAAVQKAIKVTQARGPPAENSLPPLIAYGATIPDHARISYSRAEKRRRTAAANGHQGTPDFQQPPPPQRLQAGPGPVFSQSVQSAPHPPIPVDLPGKRPTKVMLGYWLESAEPKLEDKHAVFGILGNNDMFRVKVGRETRDGRPMQSNFPQGAGALWINAHQWKREDYLEEFSRDELKEYCRVRQFQLDQGEHDETQRIANVNQAISEARRRAAYLGANKKSQSNSSNPVLPPSNHFTNAIITAPSPVHETRQAIRRSGPPAITSATSYHHEQSPMTPGFRAANRGTALPPPSHPNADPRLERATNLAMSAVSRIEANQAKVEDRDAQMLAAAPFQMTNGQNGNHNHSHPGQGGQGDNTFREGLGRLNNVWSQQEAQRIRVGNEDAKIYLGTKYERKATGPFAGKLVSQGNIISIDGEDYVEYRVLTKPSFI